MTPWNWKMLWLWQCASPAWLVAALALALYLWGGARSILQRMAAVAAALTFLLATVSPIATLADGYLFSAHVVQHLLLLLILPPLLLVALPAGATAHALRRRWLSHIASRVGAPPLSWVLGLGAMWLWHVPSLCSASVSSASVYTAQLVTLVAAGLAYAWPLLSPLPEQRISPGSAILYLFSGCVACTLLGVLLTFVPVSACPVYLHPVDELGLLPVLRDRFHLDHATDQKLGGLLMWVAPCLLYVSASVALAARWLSADARDPSTLRSGL